MKQSLLSMLAFSCLFLMTVSSEAVAQTSPGEIIVTGAGDIYAQPDMAVIRLGVTHRSDSARMAMEQVNDGVGRLMRRLVARGVEPTDVQTGQIGLHPVRGPELQSSLGGDIAWSAFEANAMLVIQLRNAAILGEVMQELLEVGGNQIFGMSFTLQDPKPFEAQARTAAVQDAISRAEQLAAAAGVELAGLLELSESGGASVRPMAEMAAARSDAMPVATGQVNVRVSVRMRFAIR